MANKETAVIVGVGPGLGAALDTVESGQPFLLPGTPALSASNARASRRALD
jgi:hypothetical protein